MKILIIGLLLAAGAGYYFLQFKKTQPVNHIEKEMLTGKWKIDSISIPHSDSNQLMEGVVSMFDSNFLKTRYDFQKNGRIFQGRPDSAAIDTAYYEWGKKNELLWKETARDSTPEIFTVASLTRDSLVFLTKDNSRIFLSRTR